MKLSSKLHRVCRRLPSYLTAYETYQCPRGFASSAGQGTLEAQQEGGKGRFRWILLFPTVFTGFLGCWQINRYQWKVDLLAKREAGLQAGPLEIFEMPTLPVEYSRVAASGEFQHDKSLYVGPRPRTVLGTANAGWVLITPLEAKEWGKAVLVNRGWVPAEWRDQPQLRNQNCPTGQVKVEGVVRKSEPRSRFVPDNDPKKGQWYWIDVPQMAAACGLPPDTPLVEVYSQDSPSEQRSPVPSSMDVLAFKARSPKNAALYPLPNSSSDLLNLSVMPVDHRNYALTWFALSASTAFLASRALKKPLASRSR